MTMTMDEIKSMGRDLQNAMDDVGKLDNGKMRTFGSGAVRDTSIDKLDYEACLSPLVLKRYAEYVKSCRVQPDGNIRADDNWQKGFGLSVWMKSKWRHLIETWLCYRNPEHGDIETSLCAEFFNTHGMLHEILANKGGRHDKDK